MTMTSDEIPTVPMTIERAKADVATALRAEGLDDEAVKRVSTAIAGFVAAVVRKERAQAEMRRKIAVDKALSLQGIKQSLDNMEGLLRGFGNKETRRG